MVEMTEVLMERKAQYGQVHQGVTNGMVKDSVIVSHNQTLNGGIEFIGRQYRSSSECSSDSQLDTLLEEADRIQTSKNGFGKDSPVKKQVRFNMERNKEYFYSYSQSSDDESHSLMSNIHFVDDKLGDGEDYNGDDNSDDCNDDYEDDDDDDNSDDDDDDFEDDCNEPESGEDDSGSEKFGYLVDKSSAGEVNNNGVINGSSGSKTMKMSGSIETVNGVNHEQIGGKFATKTEEHDKVLNGKLHQDRRLEDLKNQVLQLESSLRSRQDSVQKEMTELNSKLLKAREDTRKEMDKLQTEVADRKRHYLTEMEDIERKTNQEKKKFEEELEEFRNEKKLEERRQRYYQHEALISQKEHELEKRVQQAREQDKEIREFEEYLNRRHAVCNSKEEDLNILQNELDTLAQELQKKKINLIKKNQLSHQSSDDDIVFTPPVRARSGSRASVASRGVDLRIEELKSQNRQLLEELFTLRKACDSKEEEITDLKDKLGGADSENRRLQQRTKHLESQLELARKEAELGSDIVSVDEIMRKTTQDMRSARVSRILRPSRVVAPCSTTSSSAASKPSRIPSIESLDTKISSSSDSGKGKESGAKSASSKKVKIEVEGRHKQGSERISSALCTLM